MTTYQFAYRWVGKQCYCHTGPSPKITWIRSENSFKIIFLTCLKEMFLVIKTMSDTIITHETFDVDRIFFEDPKQYNMKGGINFSRIYPKYICPSGRVDKVYIQTPELFSWGVQENKSLDNIANYTFSFVMFDQNVGVSEEQQNMIDIFEQILSAIKTHLKKEETKEALSQFQLDAHVDMMDIFYRKKEKGQLVSGVPPMLYPKLQTKFEKTKRDGPPEIITEFRNVNDELVNPNDQLGVRCRAIGNIMIDNIYVAARRNPQYN